MKRRSPPRPRARQPFVRLLHRFASVPKSVIGGIVIAFVLVAVELAPSAHLKGNLLLIRATQLLGNIQSTANAWWENLLTWLASRRSLQEKIRTLENLLLESEQQSLQATSLKEENDYLRSLLPIVDGKNLSTLTVTMSPEPTDPYLVLSYGDAESCAGVKAGDIAFTAQGFLGTVTANQGSHVVVLTATHIRSRIPVVARQSQKAAILFGNNSSTFSVRFVRDADDSSGPFVKNPSAKKGFIDGEILDYRSQQNGLTIPVAKIVKDGSKVTARWLVTKQTRFMTLLLTIP